MAHILSAANVLTLGKDAIVPEGRGQLLFLALDLRRNLIVDIA